MDNYADIYKYYMKNDEGVRLSNNNIGRLEYDTTAWCLDGFVTPGLKVLETCAGSGIYTSYLQNKGCDVYVSDFHPKHVSYLKRHSDIDPRKVFFWDVNKPIDLNEKFDIVFCMGALYHTPYDQWSSIFDNCCSLLKKNGKFVFTYMNKAAWILKGIRKQGFDINAIKKIECFGGGPVFFASSVGEVVAIAQKKNLSIIKHIATTGIRYMVEETVNNLDNESYCFLRDYHIKHCNDTDLLGYSQYCMVVSVLT